MQLLFNSLFAISATHCVFFNFAYALQHELSQVPSFMVSALVAAMVALLWLMLRDRKRQARS